MMARKLITAVALLVFCTGPSRAAGFFTGNTIFTFCTSNVSHIYGYVGGVVDKANADADSAGATYLSLFRELHANDKFVEGMGKLQRKIMDFCIPEKVVLSQVGDIFCKYLKDKPESRQN
jgi:hypothetical protein